MPAQTSLELEKPCCNSRPQLKPSPYYTVIGCRRYYAGIHRSASHDFIYCKAVGLQSRESTDSTDRQPAKGEG